MANASGQDLGRPEGEELLLHYEGPSYMDPHTLATALDGLDELIRAAGRAGMFGQEIPDVVVLPPQEGSFDLPALISAGLGVAGWTTTFGALGAAIVWMKNHLWLSVKEFRHNAETGMVEVTWSNGTKGEVPEQQWRLYQDKKAQKALGKIAAPVGTTATSLELRAGSTGREIARVAREDLPRLTPAPEPEIAPKRFTAWVELSHVNFDGRKGWRVRHAGESWPVTIEDERFLQEVEDGSKVGKTDSFHVAIRVEISRSTSGKERHRRFIERVIEHHQGEARAEQDALLLDQGDADGKQGGKRTP